MNVFGLCKNLTNKNLIRTHQKFGVFPKKTPALKFCSEFQMTNIQDNAGDNAVVRKRERRNLSKKRSSLSFIQIKYFE